MSILHFLPPHAFADLNSSLVGSGPALADHLWQSTAFVIAAWLVTLTLRANQARVRHAVWLAASIKFLVPFALLIAAGNLLPHPKQAVAPVVYSAMDVVEEPFADVYVPVVAPVVHVPTVRERVAAVMPMGLAVLWVLGAGIVVFRWARSWRVVRRTLREAVVVDEGREWEMLRGVAAPSHPSGAWMGHPRVELRLSSERMEPGIFGVWRPVLVWPRELSSRLDDAHIEAIVAHELVHVRRRDNLSAVLHMLVETLFWFHPAVWWMERQMIKEREQACDEAVVCLSESSWVPEGEAPGAPSSVDYIPSYAETYAEALLKTCRFCIESPLPCVAGVTGADLKQRVVEIVTGRALLRMSWLKKILISTAAVCVVAAPVVLGQAKAAQRLMLAAINAAPKPMQSVAKAMLASASAASDVAADAAQSGPAATDEPRLRFEVGAIRPAAPESGTQSRRVPLVFSDDGASIQNITLGRLLQIAYEMDLTPERIVGAPDWAGSERWDIEARVGDADVAAFTKIAHENTGAGKHERSLMLQDLVARRFGIKVHHETREGTGYALVIAKGGVKAKLAAPPDPNAKSIVGFNSGNGHLDSPDVQMDMFARLLAIRMGTPIVDKTGLTERYNVTLDWQPDDATGDPTGKPFLTTALEEQLGLKLVPNKAPMDVVVIDHAQRPSVDGAEVTSMPLMDYLWANTADEAQLSGEYRKWLDEDVHWLITPQERADFLKLTTDKDRGAFVDAFWARRNPPGAAQGAYKQEVYARIAYANDHFAVTKAKPGWSTDRGRAMIQFGTPDSVEVHGDSSVQNEEIWRYNHLGASGGGLTLRFVRKAAEFHLDGAWPQEAAAQVQERRASGQVVQDAAAVCPDGGGLFTAYDVVSVRPTNAIPRMLGLQEQPDGLRSETVTVAMMVQQAFSTERMLPTNDAVSGLPDWGKGEYFAVNAKMNPEQVAAFAKLDKDQQKSCRVQMLRALLTDRFKLQVHAQSRQVLGYELVVASGSPKMKEVTASDPDVFVGASGKPMLKNLMRITPPENGGQEVIIQNLALDQLANILAGSGGVDHKVVNKTGLTGLYKYTLTYALPQGAGPAGAQAEPVASDPEPTVIKAVEDQLGLKLQRGSETVQIVAVDHVERPTAN